MKMYSSKGEIIFSAKADLQIFKDIILNIIVAAAIIYCTLNFLKNPILISILILFLLFVLLLPKRNIVVVYSNAIEFQVKNNIIPKFSKIWRFVYEDINEIDVNLQLTKKGFLFSELIGSGVLSLSLSNTIIVRLKNGNEKKIDSGVFKDELIKAFNHVVEASNGKIKIIGL